MTVGATSPKRAKKDDKPGAITLPKELRSGDDAQRVESATLMRESGAHEAFARSRMDGFVYVETPSYMHVLDAHCRFELESETSPLLVVLGHPASGKSSLLINWVNQRVKKPPAANPEVIFQHYCGCSYESVKLSVFLFRLMYHLKAAFSLRDFELPHEHEEEKLKFSLARCFEGAMRSTTQNGKRKNIIIVLDGVDNLRTEDGSESLSWLPNALPPGIRILLSATKPSKATQLASCRWIVRKEFTYDSDDDLMYEAALPPDPDDTHCIKELRRRNAGFLVVEPLDEPMCTKIIHEHATRNSTRIDSDAVASIMDSKGSSCPLYLRLILTMYDQSNHDANYLRDILNACDFSSLYELVLQQWKSMLLGDLVDALNALTQKPPHDHAPPATLPRPDSRKRNSRRESEHTAAIAASSQNSLAAPEVDEVERTKFLMERRALLARHALSLFAVSRFGLSEKDFHQLLEDAAPRPIRVQLLHLLLPHLMTIHRKDSDVVLYDISHNQLRLLARYVFLKDDALRHGYHKAIATYCEKMPTCQRRIDELPVQLECCSAWSQLQNCLVDMKMFQLWWDERNRQDFLAYWKTLRTSFSSHDPVDDYIRSLDEYIEVEGPTTEELLSLFLTITEFLRSWQRNDVKVKIQMQRPEPPQLKEFLNAQGSFSLAHLTDTESKQIQGIVDYLCPHADDGYYVRRWLWTQFPLIAVSFENLFLKKFTPPSDAADASESVAPSPMHDKKEKPVAAPSPAKPYPHAAVLPKAVASTLADKKRILARHSPKKNTMQALELLNPEESGAFEFDEPATTGEISLTIPALREQLSELRARYDKLKFLTKERQHALAALDSKLIDAKANTSHQNQNSQLRDELLEQIRLITLDSTHGKQKSDYYKSILRQCETNPARDPNASALATAVIEAAESSVRKMKQEMTELQQKAQVIGYDRRLASIEIPKLTAAIQEKLQIHQVALSRLRWRQLQNLRQMEWEAKFRMRSKEMKKQAEGDLGSVQEAAMVIRLKEKVEHKQEANQIRVKHLQDLKVYKGSPYSDDGLLGVLRHVGINEADQVLLRWHDQFEHAQQLEAEQRDGEQRVAECRRQLDELRQEFQNLKLGQTTLKPEKLLATSKSANDLAATDGPKLHNFKHVEQQLTDATAVSQQKKQRAQRLKTLSENLHVGLLHLALLLGVKASQGMDSTMLVEAVEQSVRGLIGEEGGSATPANLTLRKKNSMRKGMTQGNAPVQRSVEEKLKYNLRVRKCASPKKRLPYFDGNGGCTDDDEADDFFSDSDDSDNSGGQEDVRARADIKASSVMEVQTHSGDKHADRKPGKKKKHADA